PERAEPRNRAERKAEDPFEQQRRRDTAHRTECERSERSTDRGRDDAVAEHRVPAEPLAVPEDEAVLAEELGAEHLRREGGTAPPERDREHGGRGRDRDHREPGLPALDARGPWPRVDDDRSTHADGQSSFTVRTPARP